MHDILLMRQMLYELELAGQNQGKGNQSNLT